MEVYEDERKMLKENLVESKTHKRDEEFLEVSHLKGGVRTLPFIIANEAFEKVASYGLAPNMILYLTRDYGMEMATGTNLLFLWSAATSFMPVVGAVLSDSFIGRFLTIGLGSISSLLGMIILWLTAMMPEARPRPCPESSYICGSPTVPQLIILCSSFLLIAVGAGGVRSASLAFGADQLTRRDSRVKKSTLESFFSLYYVSSTFSILVAFTCIVYIQDHWGWKLGFGIPVLLMFLSTLSFFSASPFYAKLKANSSLFRTLSRVVVVSYKNRHLQLPSENADDLYSRNAGSDLSMPSTKLSFLNKACINLESPAILDLNKSVLADQLPGIFCTVEQVEELKGLVKVVPIWAAGIMMSVNINQSSFSLIQINSMDRHITSNFEIPGGSFAMFNIISLVIWIFLYSYIILPLATKIRGTQVYIDTKKRMGIGLLISCLSMVASAVIETIRRRTAIEQGFSDKPEAIVSMSAMWLALPYSLNGIAEAFNAIAQNEFYYSELPKSMSSIATSLFGVGMSAGSITASLILSIVDKGSKIGGEESWVASNINKGHYDYYFWVLACLSLANFGYFVVCCEAYGPSAQVGQGVQEDNEECSASLYADDEAHKYVSKS